MCSKLELQELKQMTHRYTQQTKLLFLMFISVINILSNIISNNTYISICWSSLDYLLTKIVTFHDINIRLSLRKQAKVNDVLTATALEDSFLSQGHTSPHYPCFKHW